MLGMTALCLYSCKEKKESNNIIVPKQVKKAVRENDRMSEYTQTKTVEWLGQTYTVVVHRYADEGLPKAKDETGNMYFDNKITVKVHRADGSEFFNRAFAKTDFTEYLPKDVASDGALLGMVLEKAEGDHLVFAASVGSPDSMSDAFVPLVVKVSRTGKVSVAVDIDLEG